MTDNNSAVQGGETETDVVFLRYLADRYSEEGTVRPRLLQIADRLRKGAAAGEREPMSTEPTAAPPSTAAELLLARITASGFDIAAFSRAVDEYVEDEDGAGRYDEIARTHPSNWMTREEIDGAIQDELLDLIYDQSPAEGAR